MAIPPIYSIALASTFSEGLAWVGLNGKYGFIDTKGNMAIPSIYDPYLASTFSGGLVFVIFNGEGGYIDTKGTQYWEN